MSFDDVPVKESEDTALQSVDLFFQLMKDNISNQEQQIMQLDNKANSALLAANALVTASLFVQITTGTGRAMQGFLLIVLLVTYAWTMYYGIKGYSIRNWKRAVIPVPKPNGDNIDNVIAMMEEAYAKSEDQNKKEMNEEMLKVYYDNKEIADRKVDYVRKANFWVSVETIVFILVLALQTLIPFKIL